MNIADESGALFEELKKDMIENDSFIEKDNISENIYDQSR